jgi:hypothetical protein
MLLTYLAGKADRNVGFSARNLAFLVNIILVVGYATHGPLCYRNVTLLQRSFVPAKNPGIR